MRKKLLSLLALLCLTVASAWAKKEVTITSNDIYLTTSRTITKDCVTLSATETLEPSVIRGYPIKISTSEGIFTQIVISADEIVIDGDGWSETIRKQRIWKGNASSISFNGLIDCDITIECTIEPPLESQPEYDADIPRR